MEKNKINKKGGIVLIVILVVLLLIGVFILIQSGAVERAINPCEKTFSDCNHGCGEGILNSICKEKCSYDYRSCTG